ncbi:flagellar hook-basal body protein [Gorillibacterium timonense]|uniref:flagellar hook-basal body protein n=1 Tax=Gorillibacterium timonense TaxID=1689269 RepID=UPI00071D434F|nr:flagellar hook-basal body protein [Gorillibacterium timonense]
MNASLISSMTSMNALQRKLDILGDNMANLSTTGYKRKEANFADILMNVKQQPQGFQQNGRLSPLGYVQSWGSRISQVQYDLTQGSLKETGVSTDLSVEGDALFEVNADGQTAYTRDGAFQLTAQGTDPNLLYLTTKEGHDVQGVDAAGNPIPITVRAGYDVHIAPDGTVTEYRKDDPNGSRVVGKVKLVVAVKPQFLEQIGNNLYIVPRDMDNAAAQIVRDAVAADYDASSPDRTVDTPLAVRQGWLEQSNVSMADEMADLMLVQRAYQLNARALTSADTMMNLANNLRA